MRSIIILTLMVIIGYEAPFVIERLERGITNRVNCWVINITHPCESTRTAHEQEKEHLKEKQYSRPIEQVVQTISELVNQPRASKWKR